MCGCERVAAAECTVPMRSNDGRADGGKRFRADLWIVVVCARIEQSCTAVRRMSLVHVGLGREQQADACEAAHGKPRRLYAKSGRRSSASLCGVACCMLIICSVRCAQHAQRAGRRAARATCAVGPADQPSGRAKQGLQRNAGREGTGTITPVHIVYRRRQSARCGTCRPRMRPSVRSRHRPRTHRSASSGPSMPRSAAAHCSACQLTRSGRKWRKTDARSKLNRSQAWPWPGRASAVPAEVRIVAARGYLNKRCSNIAPMQACR